MSPEGRMVRTLIRGREKGEVEPASLRGRSGSCTRTRARIGVVPSDQSTMGVAVHLRR